MLMIRIAAVDCGSLISPMNGSMLGSKTVFPNSIEFSCDEGFDLLGSTIRTCKSDGQWNGNTTICKGTEIAFFFNSTID